MFAERRRFLCGMQVSYMYILHYRQTMSQKGGGQGAAGDREMYNIYIKSSQPRYQIYFYVCIYGQQLIVAHYFKKKNDKKQSHSQIMEPRWPLKTAVAARKVLGGGRGRHGSLLETSVQVSRGGGL